MEPEEGQVGSSGQTDHCVRCVHGQVQAQEGDPPLSTPPLSSTALPLIFISCPLFFFSLPFLLLIPFFSLPFSHSLLFSFLFSQEFCPICYKLYPPEEVIEEGQVPPPLPLALSLLLFLFLSQPHFCLLLAFVLFLLLSSLLSYHYHYSYSSAMLSSVILHLTMYLPLFPFFIEAVWIGVPVCQYRCKSQSNEPWTQYSDHF